MSSEDKTQKKVSPKLISDLPYTTLKRLADRLDLPCEGNQLYWRRMVNEWSGSPYDQLTIERFAMNANRLDGSPAYALLTDMSNRGVSYGHLVSLLKKIGHHTALHGLGYRGTGLVCACPCLHGVSSSLRGSPLCPPPTGGASHPGPAPGAGGGGIGRSGAGVSVVQGTDTSARADGQNPGY